MIFLSSLTAVTYTVITTACVVIGLLSQPNICLTTLQTQPNKLKLTQFEAVAATKHNGMPV
jgi:hypothetical protein